MDTVSNDFLQSLARDAHDSFVQDLVVALQQLRLAEAQIPREHHAALIPCQESTERALRSARRTIRRLRNPGQEGDESQGGVCIRQMLQAALDDALRYSRIGGEVLCDSDELLPRDISREVCAIVKEAAVNAVRHARATRVQCEAKVGVELLIFSILDDGIGCSGRLGTFGYGVLGMKERAVKVGAEISISRLRPRGTGVVLALPRGRIRYDDPSTLALLMLQA